MSEWVELPISVDNVKEKYAIDANLEDASDLEKQDGYLFADGVGFVQRGKKTNN